MQQTETKISNNMKDLLISFEKKKFYASHLVFHITFTPYFLQMEKLLDLSILWIYRNPIAGIFPSVPCAQCNGGQFKHLIIAGSQLIVVVSSWRVLLCMSVEKWYAGHATVHLGMEAFTGTDSIQLLLFFLPFYFARIKHCKRKKQAAWENNAPKKNKQQDEPLHQRKKSEKIL